MKNKIYVAIDGNEIGKIIEKYLLCGDTETLSKFSSTLTNCILRISSFIKNNNGELIMAGGDNVLACLPEDVFLILKEFIINDTKDVIFSFSIGTSTEPLGSYLALKYAKANHLFSVRFEDNKFTSY